MADTLRVQEPQVHAPGRVIHVKTPLERIRLLVEICAFLAAGGFFVYQFVLGWFELCLSTTVETSRVHDPTDPGQDLVAVTVKFKNATGLIRISDAIAHVSYDDRTITNRLEGIHRYDHTDGRLNPEKVSTAKPRTGLGPGQEIMLATFFKVPEHAACVINTGVLVWQGRTSYLKEVRSAAISLPLAARAGPPSAPAPSRDL